MACDNLFVKWHGNGSDPSSKVAIWEWVVCGQKQCVDWAGSYNKWQDNRIGESWTPGVIKTRRILNQIGKTDGNIPIVMMERRAVEDWNVVQDRNSGSV